MAARLRLASIGRRVVGWFRAVVQPEKTEAALINAAVERPWLAEQMRFFAGDYTRRLTPLTSENFTAETPNMRMAYRAMIAEPVVKSALIEKIIQVARLGFQVVPQNKNDPKEVEAARFIQAQLKGPSGTIYEWVWELLYAGLTDGYSVCEKLYGTVEKGEWRGRWTISEIKSKDSQWLQLEVDPYLNVVGIYAMRANYGQILDPKDFVIFSHMRIFGFPTGNSDLRSSYRSAEMIKAAFRLRMILLDQYTGPFVVGKSKDPAVRQQMHRALREARAKGWIALSDQDEIEVIDLTLMSGTDKFQEAIDDFRKDMVIGIRGAYLTMLEGQNNSARGSSEEARATSDAFTWWAVMEFIGCINKQVIPDLMGPNYDDAVAHPHVILPEIDLDRIKQQLEIKGILLNTFQLPISRSGVYDMAGEAPPTVSDVLEPPQQPYNPAGTNTDEGGKPGFGMFAESEMPVRLNEYEMYAEGSRLPWQTARQECSVPGVPTNKVVQEYPPYGITTAKPSGYGMFTEEDFDPTERANLIADILFGLFGEQSMRWIQGPNIGEQFAERRNWNATLHPRDPKTGRFIPRGSGEAQSAAQEAIGRVIGGRHDAYSHEQVLGHLNNLTVKQLRSLHSQIGQKVPSNLREDMVKSVLARMPQEEQIDRSTNRPVEQPGQQAIGDRKPQQDSGGHPALAKISGDLQRSNLSPEQKAQFGQNMSSVLSRMPQGSLDRIVSLSRIQFHPDPKALNEAIISEALSSPSMRPKEKAKFERLKVDTDKGNYRIGGCFYKNGLIIDGDGNLNAKRQGEYDNSQTTQELYAHELGHAIDGPKNELSRSNEWNAAWLSEIGSGMKKLTGYAASSPAEGFAEFSRLLYGSDASLTQIEKDFPRSSEFFKDRGYWPTREAGAGGVAKIQEIFDQRIAMPGSDVDHIDGLRKDNGSLPIIKPGSGDLPIRQAKPATPSGKQKQPSLPIQKAPMTADRIQDAYERSGTKLLNSQANEAMAGAFKLSDEEAANIVRGAGIQVGRNPQAQVAQIIHARQAGMPNEKHRHRQADEPLKEPKDIAHEHVTAPKEQIGTPSLDNSAAIVRKLLHRARHEAEVPREEIDAQINQLRGLKAADLAKVLNAAGLRKGMAKTKGEMLNDLWYKLAAGKRIQDQTYSSEFPPVAEFAELTSFELKQIAPDYSETQISPASKVATIYDCAGSIRNSEVNSAMRQALSLNSEEASSIIADACLQPSANPQRKLAQMLYAKQAGNSEFSERKHELHDEPLIDPEQLENEKSDSETSQFSERKPSDEPKIIINMPEIKIEIPEQKPPVVNVSVPTQKAPVVNVTVPEQPAQKITVPQPQIVVNVPEQPAPNITVNVPEKPKKKYKIKHDDGTETEVSEQ